MDIGHLAEMDARTPALGPKPPIESVPMTDTTAAGWRADAAAGTQQSLPEVNSTISVPFGGHWSRRLLAFLGPGYLVSVGYMDPGNWATDLAGGSKFGYTLLSVILLSNLMAILLQALAARLGIVTDRDLAQACRATLFASRQLPALAGLRGRHHRLRSRRGHRHRDRAQIAVRHSPDRRRADHRARRLPAAAADEQGFPLPRSLRHLAVDRDRDLLCDPDRGGRAAGGRRS